MQISRAIALQTLTVCAGLVLITAVTIYSWNRYEQSQDDAGRNALALQDFRLLEETSKSWLLNNDLIFASDQNFLIMNTRRQGELVTDVASSLMQSSLGAVAIGPLTVIVELVEQNSAALSQRQFVSENYDSMASLDLWDQRSLAVSDHLEYAREKLNQQADLRAQMLSTERNFLIRLCVISYLMFGLLVVILWRWLTLYLARPLAGLTGLADAALRAEQSLELDVAGPEEVQQLTESINAYTHLREQRANERAKALQNEVDKRIKAEELARASAHKARDASKAKSQFLANMSHEIRTPLNGIIGSAEILTLDPSPEKTAWGLQNIQKSGEHLLSLINQILDFSKIEAGQLELDPHPFMLDDLLGKLRSIFVVRAIDKDVEFLFDIAPDVPVHLEGDSLRIRQVLTNLLGNAFTYTETGSVTLRCSSGAGLHPGKRTLTWEVIDSGKGIPLEQQNHIFDSFRQADSGTTRAYGGTGLGLAISKQLVELMGGNIEVESTPGTGSTFRCTMDVIAHPEPAGTKASRTGDAAVFVKNPTARRPLERLLQSRGWSVSRIDRKQVEDGSAKARLSPAVTLFIDHVTQPESRALLEAAREQGCDRIIFDNNPSDCVGSHDAKECVLSTALIPGELFRSLKSMRRQPARQSESADGGPDLHGHVLLVEDNPVNQTVTQHMMALMGLTVSIVDDGEAAVEFVQGETPDLILMDWHMPKKDGITATKEIRELEQNQRRRRTPIVMFTADAQKENEQICRRAGANELLPKPIKLETLKETLAALL